MRFEIKTSTKRTRHIDRFGVEGARYVYTVELTIGGVSFYHECENAEQARALAARVAFEAGLLK